jgi:hypothetical protein
MRSWVYAGSVVTVLRFWSSLACMFCMCACLCDGIFELHHCTRCVHERRGGDHDTFAPNIRLE